MINTLQSVLSLILSVIFIVLEGYGWYEMAVKWACLLFEIVLNGAF